MSYVGYDQIICKAGHLYVVDVQHSFNCECGAMPYWVNSVDDTNGESYGKILDFSSLLIEGEKTETCPCCQNTKVTALAQYRVPNEEEMKRLRFRRETLDNGEHRWVNIQEDNATREVVED